MQERLFRVLFAICALVFTGSTAAQAHPLSLTADQIESIRALIRKTMDAHRAPGASFAIGLGGKVAWSEGFGYADVENQVKATPDTAYRTASIGKPTREA